MNFAAPSRLKSRTAAAILACAAPLWAFLATDGAAEDKPGVMVIVDSSNSMWGQIEGKNKVVIAREVLGDVFKTQAGKVRMGLVAYGHQKSAGCDDVKTVAPLGDINTKKYKKILSSFRPKGSTPIAVALRTAAAAGGHPEKPVSLVLLSDGLDNCQGDPCAAARELVSQGGSLRAHVIAFDSKNQDKLKSLSCVATATGGVFVGARNKAELAGAFKSVMTVAAKSPVKAKPPEPKTAKRSGAAAKGDKGAAPTGSGTPDGAGATVGSILEITKSTPGNESTASLGGTGETAARPAPIPDKVPARTEPKKPKKPKSGKQTLKLSAHLTEESEAIGSGLVWRIFEGRARPGGDMKVVSTHRSAKPSVVLKTGSYIVNVAYGRANVTRRIVINGDKVEGKFVLDAGGLRLKSLSADGKAIARTQISYQIFSADKDQFGNRKLLLSNIRSGVIIRLNADTYHVVSQYGDANATVRSDISVQAGKLTDATINHRAARVTFKLVLQEGGEAIANTRWSVLSPGGDVVKESAGALPSHILAAGTYTVLARYNDKNYTRDFTVEPGDVTEIEVVIN